MIVTTNFHFATTGALNHHLGNVLRFFRIKDNIALDSITRMVERTRINEIDSQGHQDVIYAKSGYGSQRSTLVDDSDESRDGVVPDRVGRSAEKRHRTVSLT